MGWRGGRRSSNIQDRRGRGGSMRMPRGGGGGLRIGGLGGIVFAVSRRTDGVTWISDASEVHDLLGGDLEPLRCDPDLGFAVPVP